MGDRPGRRASSVRQRRSHIPLSSEHLSYRWSLDLSQRLRLIDVATLTGCLTEDDRLVCPACEAEPRHTHERFWCRHCGAQGDVLDFLFWAQLVRLTGPVRDGEQRWDTFRARLQADGYLTPAALLSWRL